MSHVSHLYCMEIPEGPGILWTKKKKKKRLRDTDRSLWNKTIPVTGNG